MDQTLEIMYFLDAIKISLEVLDTDANSMRTFGGEVGFFLEMYDAVRELLSFHIIQKKLIFVLVLAVGSFESY